MCDELSDFMHRSDCHECGKECGDGAGFRWSADGMICDACHALCYQACAGCGDPFRKRGASRWGCAGLTTYCQGCSDAIRHYECSSCNKLFEENSPEWTAGHDDMCFMCAAAADASEEIPYRDYAESPALVAPNGGEILRSTRPVGIELEVEFGTNKQMRDACRRIPRSVGIGSDSSIQGNGAELRFPPAAGAQAETLVRDVCAALKDNGISVNPSCGYHVHLDMSDLEAAGEDRQIMFIRRLWVAYLAFEDVIKSFLPPSRHSNRYCKPIKSEYSIGELMDCRTRDELERMWYRVRTAAKLQELKSDSRHSYSDDQTRYRGVNFHSLWKDGHLEIRYHTGTVNPDKILHWANLHATIVDWASNAGDPSPSLAATMRHACNSMDMAEKTNMFFGLFRVSPREEGYYRARQEKFRIREAKTAVNEHFDAGMRIVEEEREL